MEAQTEYLEANSYSQLSHRDEEDAPRWTAPAEGFTKINWDTAICSKWGTVGMGAVIHDSAGRVLATRCQVTTGRFAPFAAEAWAGGQAFIFGKELGLTNIILEGDSRIVVDAVNSAEGSGSLMGHLIEDMKIMLQDFPVWKALAVRRSANNAAHEVARMAVRENIVRTWNCEVPDCIHATILGEISSPNIVK